MSSSSAVRRRVREGGPPSKLASLGIRAAGVLLKHASFETVQGVSAMRRPIETLAEALGQLGPLELFSEWSPPRDPPLVPVALPAVAAASNQKSSEFDASKALTGDQSTYWNSGSCKTAWWSVTLDPPALVAAVKVQFRLQQMPDTLLVEVAPSSPSRSTPAWQAVATVSGKAISELTVVTFREPCSAAQVRLTCSGRHPTQGGEDSYGVWRVDLTGPPPQAAKGGPAPPPSRAETLSQLQMWLVMTARAALLQEKQQLAVGSQEDAQAMCDVFDVAVRALAALARASGSLGASLQLVEALLSTQQRSLSSTAAAAMSHLFHAVRSQIARQGALQAAAEFELSRSCGSAAGAGGPTYGPLPVAFDPSASSQGGNLSFSNGDKTVSSASTGGNTHTYALMTAGPFTEGRAAWEFRLDEDTNSQCSCFGAAIKPVVTANYESSKEMWMYRAYNGHRYANGSNFASGRGEDDKIKKGDTVRFDLDFDEADGVIRMQINGRDKGVVFTGLRGKALYPAIAFYASNRSISALHVEGPSTAASGADGASPMASLGGGGLPRPPSDFLCDLDEHHTTVNLGKHGAGAAGDGGKVKVAGITPQQSLCMQPPPGDGSGADDDEGENDDEGDDDGDEGPDGGASARSLTLTAGAAEQAAQQVLPPDELQIAKLRSAAQLTKRKFERSAATAVYWLGGAYESLRGSVALAETAVAQATSPVVFEVLGDEKVLWRSAPIQLAKVAAEPFCVPLIGVDVLRLVVRAVRGNEGAIAVWVDPVLDTVGAWYCHGWRNHRSARSCAVTGLPRGIVPAVPTAAGALSQALSGGSRSLEATEAQELLATSHGAGSALLLLTAKLAVEYLREMRSMIPVSQRREALTDAKKADAALAAEVDLESPFAVEASEAVLRALARLIKGISWGGSIIASSPQAVSASATTANGIDRFAEPAVHALLQIARATLRRGVASGINLVASGFAATSEAGAGASSGGRGGSDKAKPSSALLELAGEVQTLTTWGGSTSGVPLSQIPAPGDDTRAFAAAASAAAAGKPAAALRCAPAVQDAAWLLLEYLPLGGTTALLMRKACAGAGVLELELTWPWHATEPQPPPLASASTTLLPPLPVHMEALILSLQLHAAQHGWRHHLAGCWPSRLSVVIDVPASPGVAGFVAGDFAALAKEAGAVFNSSGSNHTLASGLEFPLLLERCADFDRLQRIDTLPGFGALHVYPGFAATFDQVKAAVAAFLPPERSD